MSALGEDVWRIMSSSLVTAPPPPPPPAPPTPSPRPPTAATEPMALARTAASGRPCGFDTHGSRGLWLLGCGCRARRVMTPLPRCGGCLPWQAERWLPLLMRRRMLTAGRVRRRLRPRSAPPHAAAPRRPRRAQAQARRGRRDTREWSYEAPNAAASAPEVVELQTSAGTSCLVEVEEEAASKALGPAEVICLACIGILLDVATSTVGQTVLQYFSLDGVSLSAYVGYNSLFFLACGTLAYLALSFIRHQKR